MEGVDYSIDLDEDLVERESIYDGEEATYTPLLSDEERYCVCGNCRIRCERHMNRRYIQMSRKDKICIGVTLMLIALAVALVALVTIISIAVGRDCFQDAKGETWLDISVDTHLITIDYPKAQVFELYQRSEGMFDACEPSSSLPASGTYYPRHNGSYRFTQSGGVCKITGKIALKNGGTEYLFHRDDNSHHYRLEVFRDNVYLLYRHGRIIGTTSPTMTFKCPGDLILQMLGTSPDKKGEAIMIATRGCEENPIDGQVRIYNLDYHRLDNYVAGFIGHLFFSE